MLNKFYIIGLTLITYSSMSFAYKFDSDLQNPKNSVPAHEKLTGLAYDCVLSYKGKKPIDCINKLKFPKNRGINSDTYFKTIPLETSINIPFSKKELMKVSGWPDDPVRELQFKSALKSGAKFLSKCANKKESVRAGFFCNSHFGQLQFWHAMASYRTDKQGPESYTETREKILSWAWFAYSIALGEIALEEKYCDTFEKLRNKPGREYFAESFYPAVDAKRTDSDFLYCPKNKSNTTKMTVASIFNNLCADAFDSSTCTVVYDSREIYMAALGATIHVIQDSYSQSHADRNSCSEVDPETGEEKPTSIISCHPISKFYDYASQSTGKHGVSDYLPVLVDKSCGKTKIHDAITATAMIIWYAMRGEEAEKVEEYISDHVLVIAEEVDDNTIAEAGACYVKDKWYSKLFN